MEEKFQEILEKDEKIIKVIKPKKSRYVWASIGPFAIPICWPFVILLVVGSLFTLPFFMMKGYKNLYYAYTNKRLIVRRGVFGNTYDSLEYKDITSTSVQVGFFDKNGKTGTLLFVSPSSHHEHPMRFAWIENPYKEMNEIKQCMSKLENK